MKIEITIPGEPKTQQRHRTFKRGTFTGTYDPSEKDKKNFLVLCMGNKPDRPIDSPINMELKFYSGRPKNHYGTGKNANVLKQNAPYFNISRPDIDNLQKFVMDSLNSIFYRDDSLICLLSSVKLYDDIPRTEITIETL
jgi:Holliday junction resolvase RusA-like endonuclease